MLLLSSGSSCQLKLISSMVQQRITRHGISWFQFGCELAHRTNQIAACAKTPRLGEPLARGPLCLWPPPIERTSERAEARLIMGAIILLQLVRMMTCYCNTTSAPNRVASLPKQTHTRDKKLSKNDFLQDQSLYRQFAIVS